MKPQWEIRMGLGDYVLQMTASIGRIRKEIQTGAMCHLLGSNKFLSIMYQ